MAVARSLSRPVTKSLPPFPTKTPLRLISGQRTPASGKRKARHPQTQAIAATDRMAAIVLRAIKTELGDVDFFTREDCLYLSVLSHVSTITRYQDVCGALAHLIAEGEVIAKSRTDLCLPTKARRYVDEPLAQQYLPTIRKIVARMDTGTRVDVMSVVNAWSMDQHLTTNGKRVAVRNALKILLREGLFDRGEAYDYIVKGKTG